jgi:hypothetical protein
MSVRVKRRSRVDQVNARRAFIAIAHIEPRSGLSQIVKVKSTADSMAQPCTGSAAIMVSFHRELIAFAPAPSAMPE